MSCVVADTGPLVALAHLELLNLPHELFETSPLIPQSVLDECLNSAFKPGVEAIKSAVKKAYFSVMPDPVIPKQIASFLLGRGELSALALALEQQGIVLMDDAKARRAAERLSIPVIGVCGLLLAAKNKKLIGDLAPLLSILLERGYFLAPMFCAEVLRLAGESSTD